MSSETPDRGPEPARKCLVRHARFLGKKKTVWIQGVVVWTGENQFAIDDGSGIARVDVLNHRKRDLASCVLSLKVGDYVLAVGEVIGRYKGHRLGLRATTVRTLTQSGDMMESMWHLEVIDAFLYRKEKEREDEGRRKCRTDGQLTQVTS
ncbi:hypothetical protein BWQ96_07723 [Gracilariopsis chorda]|uniref:CST complex subunit STN1 n=1 Tax=Gracilariopsis chorda TaxID=448386 RepID=A0A2V3IKH0_9FLOR|nr:hypothetical protein BWQ96_07723 [Gracilariopsis chorda]|eukprot:PXF42561.1 hypothetical protein BWQ96_07723 [Gracilariopsis chorda]